MIVQPRLMPGVDARQCRPQGFVTPPRRIRPILGREAPPGSRPSRGAFGSLPGHGLLTHVRAAGSLIFHTVEGGRVAHEGGDAVFPRV